MRMWCVERLMLRSFQALTRAVFYTQKRTPSGVRFCIVYLPGLAETMLLKSLTAVPFTATIL